MTSRDHLNLQLSRLPKVCHDEIVTVFGGKSLKELAAAEIADRLRNDDIPITELQRGRISARNHFGGSRYLGRIWNGTCLVQKAAQ